MRRVDGTRRFQVSCVTVFVLPSPTGVAVVADESSGEGVPLSDLACVCCKMAHGELRKRPVRGESAVCLRGPAMCLLTIVIMFNC